MTTTSEADSGPVEAETVDAAPGDADAVSDAAGGQESAPDADGGNAEAKKWRKKLREAEAARDRLVEQVQSMQRGQVDALVSAAGLKPQAVWAVTDLDALLDAGTGAVDTELVTAAIRAASDTLGVQPVGKGNVVPGVGTRPTYDTATVRDDFTDAFRPRRR